MSHALVDARLSVASGSLRPFGPVSRSNVAHSTACPRVRATFERLTGPKGLREPEATLELRVHECVRHSNHSQARRALGSRRPHSNRVSTSACDTRLNCIVVMSHILV